MKQQITLSFLLLGTLLLISSCSTSLLSHKMYNRSYYVKAKKQTENIIKSQVYERETVNLSLLASSDTEIQPSVQSNAPKLTKTTNVVTLNNHDPKLVPISILTECDEIILKEGKILKVKVIEITDTDVKYKLCDNQEGPTYNVKKSEVLLIKYSNGKEENFKSNTKQESKMDVKDRKFREELLLIGILAGLAVLAAVLIFEYPSYL